VPTLTPAAPPLAEHEEKTALPVPCRTLIGQVQRLVAHLRAWRSLHSLVPFIFINEPGTRPQLAAEAVRRVSQPMAASCPVCAGRLARRRRSSRSRRLPIDWGRALSSELQPQQRYELWARLRNMFCISEPFTLCASHTEHHRRALCGKQSVWGCFTNTTSWFGRNRGVRNSAFLAGAADAFNSRSKARDLSRRASLSMKLPMSCRADTIGSKRCLVIGGTRFSGVYLAKVLGDLGHEVVLYNRGSKPLQRVPNEPEGEFAARAAMSSTIIGDRTKPDEVKEKLASENFDAIFDMNGRELEDTRPFAELFAGKIDHYVYMSSAGVYLQSPVLPHIEGDACDPKSRHLGKLQTEEFLDSHGLPWTAIRPTYIYGPSNYNPIEEWFFARIAEDRPIPIPGDGTYMTGLGHVADLANAFAAVLGNPRAVGKVYNIQDRKSVTYNGIAKMCALAMGRDPESIRIVHYDPNRVDIGKAKAFPFRLQHFFTSVNRALRELDWDVDFDLLDGLRDSYHNDFLPKKQAGKLQVDFKTDDLILSQVS